MKRLSILAVVLVVALALTGVAYGLWSTNLLASIDVQTGSVSAKFVNLVWNEWPEVENKDVGTCSVALAADDELTVKIDNGYPGFGCDLSVVIKNTGSIPVKVQTIQITKNFTDAISSTFLTSLSALCGQQIHADDVVTVTGNVEVKQPAQQNTNYWANVQLQLVQWNEYDENASCPTVVIGPLPGPAPAPGPVPIGGGG